MELLTSFNRERSLTVLMVTHEAEMAAYASRQVHFLDGLIVSPSAAAGGH
jgi:putative ABC transport system ATP-binding protein